LPAKRISPGKYFFRRRLVDHDHPRRANLSVESSMRPVLSFTRIVLNQLGVTQCTPPRHFR